MSLFAHPLYLRRVLLLDAVGSTAVGVAQVALTGWLASVLALPPALLTWSGVFVLVYSALVIVLAMQPRLSERPLRTLVWVIVVNNLVWAADALILLASGWVHPNALGTAWVLMHAGFTATMAQLQWMGLRAQPAVRGW